ncbi:hypothetical protein FRC07_010972 [Ceratobasidium sp. 392]|nr:hypothetical protein FRC07_010972 [Ceratobasidium sp. 392]
MADSQAPFPSIKGPGARVQDPIKIDLSDDKQASPLTHGGNNAARPPPTPTRRRRRLDSLMLHTVGASKSVPQDVAITERRQRCRFVYKLGPKTPTTKMPKAPRTGVLPELPELPKVPRKPLAPRPRPLSHLSLLQQLLLPGSRVSVPFAFLTRPLQYRLGLARVQLTRDRPCLLAVCKADLDAWTLEPAVDPTLEPVVDPTPGPIVVEEIRRLTYVGWGRPDTIADSGVLLWNKSVAVKVMMLE